MWYISLNFKHQHSKEALSAIHLYYTHDTLYFFNSQMLECLKEEIENMRPPSDALENFRLLLVGPVGSGKSSFCNTVASVFRGRITQRAMVGESNNSVTTTVSSYLFILSLRWCYSCVFECRLWHNDLVTAWWKNERDETVQWRHHSDLHVLWLF